MKFNILIIGQSGRLQYEAILFFGQFTPQSAPDFNGQVFVAEPQHKRTVGSETRQSLILKFVRS